MKAINRYSTPEFSFEKETFHYLEDINEGNIESILEALESCISNGWVGEASEISDTLQRSPIINNNPEWRSVLDIERMKRYQYFELNNNAINSSIEIIEYLNAHKDTISDEKYNNWMFTAIGQMGWLENDPGKLEKIIHSCKELLECSQAYDSFLILQAFYTALQGRLAFFASDVVKGEHYFGEALKIVADPKYIRSYSHIIVYFTDLLNQCGQSQKAFDMLTDFLVTKQPIKTHLLIRIYCFLFQYPLSEEEKERYSYPFQYILFAMGLNQASINYPLIRKAKSLIPENRKIDFYNLSLERSLENRIKHLRSKTRDLKGSGYEKFIAQYYRDRGFEKVKVLFEAHEGFDIIASLPVKSGSSIHFAIQTKLHNVKVNDVPDLDVLRTGLRKIEEEYEIRISQMDWYSDSGTYNNAVGKLRRYCTQAGISLSHIADTSEVVKFYLENPAKLIHILNCNFWDD